MPRATTCYTTGKAGAGKSYMRVRFLADEFLLDESGSVITNLPVNVKALAAFVAAKRKDGPTAEEIERRIRIIPQEEIRKWRRQASGPWEYFAEEDIRGAHIILDEAHTVANAKHKAPHKIEWQEFCGELRHRGASIEFITQHEAKLATEIRNEAESWIEITTDERRRHFLLGNMLGDWYELKAAWWSGEYRAGLWETEYRFVKGKAVVEREKRVDRDPVYFPLYDSYSAATGGAKKVDRPEYQFERRGRWGTLAWFGRRNAWGIFSRAVVFAFCFYLFGGGGKQLLSIYLARVDGIVTANRVGTDADDEDADPEPAGPVESPAGTPDETLVVAAADDDRTDAMWNRLRSELLEAREVARAATERADQVERSRVQAEREAVFWREYVEHGSMVAMLTDEFVVMADGSKYRLGEVIEGGSQRGRTVSRIDYARRRVELDDGTVLRLGSLGVPQRDTTERFREADESYVPPILRGGPGAPRRPDGRGGRRAEDQFPIPGSSPPVVRSSRLRGDGRLDRRR